MLLSRWWTSKNYVLLPSRINPEETTGARGDHGSKGWRAKNCQKLWGNLKGLMSWRVSVRGCAVVWSGGWREGAERGELEECSVLLLPLQQTFTHTHTQEGWSLAAPSPQSLMMAIRVHRVTAEQDKGPVGMVHWWNKSWCPFTLGLVFLHLQTSRVIGKDAPFNADIFLEVESVILTQADAQWSDCKWVLSRVVSDDQGSDHFLSLNQGFLTWNS